MVADHLVRLYEIRQSVLKSFHSVTSRVFGYTATCTNEQHVGQVPMRHDEIVDKLAESQFSKNFVSALKYRDGKEIADSSWVYRSSLFSSYQTHVLLFDGDNKDTVDVYAHHEHNSLRSPIKHARIKYVNGKIGAVITKLLFNQANIPFETETEPDTINSSEKCIPRELL